MGQAFSGMGSSNPDDMGTGTKLLEGGTKGLATGFQNMQQQNAQMRQGGGGMMPQTQGAPTVDPAYFAPQRKPIQGNNLAFYGGS
jgi:hypothetical protein